MSSLEIQAQALLLRKIEEEKARILDMHRRQQELFQKGLIQQSSIQQLIQVWPLVYVIYFLGSSKGFKKLKNWLEGKNSATS